MKRAILVVAALLLTGGVDAAGIWAPNVWSPDIWADDIFDPGGPLIVPDVLGLSTDDADNALEVAGLDTGAVVAQCSDEGENVVLSQWPAAGAEAELGALVDLVVSSGVECTVRGSTGIRIGIGIGL